MRKRLFTPGPLTTTDSVRSALNVDWGSRDSAFSELTKRVRDRLTQLVNGADSHSTVLLQGAGTFAVEATLATLVGPSDTLLVLVNGEYGRRITTIAQRLGKSVQTLEFDELAPVPEADVAGYLKAHPEISHVALVQLETTTGVLNPYFDIAKTVANAGRALVLDAMSGFGCYPVDVQTLPCTAVIASSNKGLHGVPGIGFAIIDKAALSQSQGNCASLSLDLHDQWKGFENNGQWRFTPPTQCLAALDQAIEEFLADGGETGRRNRYDINAAMVLQRLQGLGFAPLIAPEHRSSVILTFGFPKGDWFNFPRLYDQLAKENLFLYPGKLTDQPSFRIGCIGALDRDDFEAMLTAFEHAVQDMTSMTDTLESDLILAAQTHSDLGRVQ
ncbi:MAG: 2-aminoethylphosphonate--pyruvate transaminase [Pseudophaeobacter sp.]|uniref:2-aminoethylphosphonate--pyruvate transaminase n=1 Tax=Pseudophaeobacter sp. TaxID=1971739 RepID=UPI0032982B6C